MRDLDALYEGFLSPARCQALPEGTRERAATQVAVRLLWHRMFDACPKLVKALSPPDGMILFRQFMAWADEFRPSMGWSLHLRLLSWLMDDASYGAGVTDELVVELLAAAASRWASYDRGPNGGVVIGCQRLADKVIAGWKCHTADRARNVVALRISGDLKLEGLLGYFVVPGFSLDAFVPWQDIPW